MRQDAPPDFLTEAMEKELEPGPVAVDVTDILDDAPDLVFSREAHSYKNLHGVWSKGPAVIAPEFNALESIMKHTGRTGKSHYNLEELHQEWLEEKNAREQDVHNNVPRYPLQTYKDSPVQFGQSHSIDHKERPPLSHTPPL